MKILILEDEDTKFNQINEHVLSIIPDAEIHREKTWHDYSVTVVGTKFDLILLDLIVPRSQRDSTVEDHHESLVDTTRDYRSQSFRTPAIVLTRHNLNEGDFVHDLNLVDINVIHFNEHGQWREALEFKLLAAKPPKKFDAVIICAIQKEADAFEGLTDTWGDLETISGLLCREVQIGKYKTVIVHANRMGLVSSAVASAFAIDRFNPRLICMSGICGGVKGESNIYDLLITQSCHQHDAGKWTTDGFKSEHYDIPIKASTHNTLSQLASKQNLKSEILNTLNPGRSEFPKGVESINFKIHPNAITSSGSAVIAEEKKTGSLSIGQRKLSGFDMEVYSVYEAARLAPAGIAFFAAKSVVDDGGRNKGDAFHRIACLISAHFVVAAIRAGICET